MTDAEKKGQEQQKDEKKGKWWFFDIFNEELRKNNVKKAKNDRDLANANRHLDNAKASAKNQMSDGKKAVKSLIKNRVDMGKARLKNGCIDTRVTLLGWREKAAMFKATAKALFKFDAKKGVLERVEDAQKDVAEKYGAKRESLLDKRKKVEKRDGSIGRNVKSVLKGEVKSFMVSAERRIVKRKHKNINMKLNIDKGILNCLGILTSPAKLTAEGVKWTGNQVKRGYDYVTNPQNIITAAEKVGRTVNKTKREIRKVRVLGGRDLLHFKMGAKKKWNAGVKFSKNVVRGIKEAPGRALDSLQGCYKKTIGKAITAYNNSNVGKFFRAVRTGYQVGVAAYATPKGR